MAKKNIQEMVVKFSNGKPNIQFNFLKLSNGKKVKDGVETWWFRNGKKQKEITWKKAILHGSWKEWHENGKVRMQSTFTDGKQNGLFTMWDDRGKKVHESKWRNGILKEKSATNSSTLLLSVLDGSFSIS